MKQIVVLMGSPRRNGNTDLLTQAFIKGAESAGHTVDVIVPADLRINGCIGCNACHRDPEHKCVFDDDMTQCYRRLSAADVIVAATPVYFYSVSAQLKALVDRLHNPVRQSFRVKKLGLLAVCEEKDKWAFDGVIAMYRSILSYFSLEDAGIVAVHGVKDKGDILGHPLLEEAKQMGISI